VQEGDIAHRPFSDSIEKKPDAWRASGFFWSSSRNPGKDVVDLHKHEKKLAIALTPLDASFLVIAMHIDMHLQNAEVSYAIARNT